jgi:hypothetical protein
LQKKVSVLHYQLRIGRTKGKRKQTVAWRFHGTFHANEGRKGSRGSKAGCPVAVFEKQSSQKEEN